MEPSLPQITYLFGAGASAQVLPTIKALPSRIEAVANYIKDNYIFDDADIIDKYFNKNEAKNYLIEGLKKLHLQSNEHSTIDTFAKKLHISGNNHEVDELIFFLTLYFNIEQKISRFDPRYETFLISILSSNTNSFPSNVKFLTWNYDVQMELAHFNISNKSNHYIDHERFDNNQRIDSVDKEKFASIKINGSCSLSGFARSTSMLINGINSRECKNDDLDFALAYGYLFLKKRNYRFDYYPNIKFAWYQDYKFIDRLATLYDKTEVLVVIGYSFPFFNRDVDRKIIQNMKHLKKIYIQDLNPESIKSRFLSVLPNWETNGIQIINVNDITEFFLPPEL